jgi:hypothetical protein
MEWFINNLVVRPLRGEWTTKKQRGKLLNFVLVYFYMTSDKLTNLQHELLKVFQYNLSEGQLLEIRGLLATYFAEKATDEMDRLWETQSWNEDTMKRWAKEHTRTLYKS